jgi:CheY-like chemotaxis protein
LILLDLSLPDIHGFDVLNKLKSNSRIKNIPVVAVSADAMDSTIKTALSHGCIDYITKPINFQTLRKCIDKALKIIRL